MEMPIVYGQLHAFMESQGIACITPDERERREQMAEAMIKAATRF